jgi:hypothetical protein
MPPKPPANPSARTFCLLPDSSSDAFQHFIPACNTLAENEVRAHVTMFEPPKNDGYYHLGLEAAAIIRQAIANGRPLAHTTVPESAVHSQLNAIDAGGDQKRNAGTDEGTDLLL